MNKKFFVIIMISIPYNQGYKFELDANCAIQLAFEVEGQKYIQQIISNLSKKVIGLHMRLNSKGDRIFFEKNFLKVFAMIKTSIFNPANTFWYCNFRQSRMGESCTINCIY